MIGACTVALAVVCAAAGDGPERHHAVWLKPVGTVYSFAIQRPGFTRLDTPRAVGLGGQFSIDRRFSLTLDLDALTPSMLKSEHIVSPGFLFTIAPGVMMHLMGPGVLKGFFIQPRIAISFGDLWNAVNGTTGAKTPSRSVIAFYEVMAIVDVGVQWHFGRFFAAVAIGGGGGLCVHCADRPAANAFEALMADEFGDSSNTRGVWVFDLNFLRLGVAL